MAGTRMIVRGAGSASTARKLIGLSKVANHMVNETVELAEGRYLMNQDGIVAGVQMYEGQYFYAVASVTAPGRAFIVTRRCGLTACSASSFETKIKMIRKAKAYAKSLHAGMQQAA